MNEELKPCPFCGFYGTVKFDTDGTKDSMGRKWAYTVSCDRCCASTGGKTMRNKSRKRIMHELRIENEKLKVHCVVAAKSCLSVNKCMTYAKSAVLFLCRIM